MLILKVNFDEKYEIIYFCVNRKTNFPVKICKSLKGKKRCFNTLLWILLSYKHIQKVGLLSSKLVIFGVNTSVGGPYRFSSVFWFDGCISKL